MNRASTPLKRWIIRNLIDFNLFVLRFGPKDDSDREMERQLYAIWRANKP